MCVRHPKLFDFFTVLTNYNSYTAYASFVFRSNQLHVTLLLEELRLKTLSLLGNKMGKGLQVKASDPRRICCASRIRNFF
jgi:hypothetical protein